jgi:hypothetical protein
MPFWVFTPPAFISRMIAITSSANVSAVSWRAAFVAVSPTRGAAFLAAFVDCLVIFPIPFGFLTAGDVHPQ